MSFESDIESIGVPFMHESLEESVCDNFECFVGLAECHDRFLWELIVCSEPGAAVYFLRPFSHIFCGVIVVDSMFGM